MTKQSDHSETKWMEGVCGCKCHCGLLRCPLYEMHTMSECEHCSENDPKECACWCHKTDLYENFNVIKCENCGCSSSQTEVSFEEFFDSLSLSRKTLVNDYLYDKTNKALQDQLIRIESLPVMQDEELPTSAELEKIFKANEGNISRSEILEAEDTHILGRNDLRNEIRKAIQEMRGGEK